MPHLRPLLATLALFAAGSAIAASPPLLEPGQLIADASLPKSRLDAQILAARRYATFWDSGDPALAHQALAESFTDRTLPAGRPQGIEGPLKASAMMKAAFPDLHCRIEQMLVTGDRVVLHLRFSGRFTGPFLGRQGTGQAVDFIATDIYRIADGRITDNWHIEDNLSLLRQLGVVSN
ncbi:ester cyclase [Pseudomonas sp. NY15181]|uniref:ester cyclase n=1 Tax=Pseudomonas sp. NY15181 TaxID=3400349 RepID=UPI003A89DAA7